MSLRDQLEQVYQARGELTPQALVDTARPKMHPLHDRFEWNDKVASEAYRRDQAHRLIQSVRVAFISSDRPKDVRAFVAIPRPESAQPSYERVEDVLADPVKKQIVLNQMEREWRTMQARYGDLVEFSELVLNSLVQS
jgi:hypothetical protein